MTVRFKPSHSDIGVNYLDTFDPAVYAPNWDEGELRYLPFEVGMVAIQGNQGAEIMFVKAGAALTEGDVCYIDQDFIVTPLTTTNGANKIGFKVCVALGAVTSGHHCWVQVNGLCDVKLLASAAVGARYNTTATSGSLDDDGTAGARQILGIANTVVVGGSAALSKCMLTDPTVGPTL